MMKKNVFLWLLLSLSLFNYTSGQDRSVDGSHRMDANKPQREFETTSEVYKISLEKLRDKIKGGWAGQTIGVTFGGPYEFKFNGSFIQEYQPLFWKEGYVKETMLNNPGLYDDVYVDLTFLEVLDKLGIDAPADSFAEAFAKTKYHLWHANQAARYNLLNGINAPGSGYWKNNPHADDIDYQIEADFAGIISPGMPNVSSWIGDKVGHIMNYGDGWYGGIFISAMYAYAYVLDDIGLVVENALEAIPAQSDFYKIISDVILWHRMFPEDWHQTWFKLQREWSSEFGCPDGVFEAFNIDAKINAAYVVMGLLYGNGDFSKTLDIATRAGQDADCNPASAGGVLGTFLGYNNIPEKWRKGLEGAEDINFKYTTTSLNRANEISYKLALNSIEKNGGNVNTKYVSIPKKDVKTVNFEKAFEGLKPIDKVRFTNKSFTEISFDFVGKGFVLQGYASSKDTNKNYVFDADLWVDGIKIESAKFPTDFTIRRLELFWNYDLKPGNHKVKVMVKNPNTDFSLNTTSFIVYE